MFGMVAVLAASLLVSARRPGKPDKKLRILSSFLPVYVFALNVVGDAPDVEVDLLLSPDLGCPHDYALRPADMIRIGRADLVIVNGLGAEPFMAQLLAEKSQQRVLAISDDVDPICSHEGGEGDAQEHGSHEGHDHDMNPHVWVSPAQAARQVRTLARKLAGADPARADRYRANGEAYARRLEAMQEQMRAAAGEFRSRNIVTFHDAFAYLARDLDLHVAATLTPDPQSGISAWQRAELSRTVREKNVAAIFYEQAYSDRVAKSLSHETGVPAYALNPFNYYEGQPDAGSYRRVMEQNLRTLEQALGGNR